MFVRRYVCMQPDPRAGVLVQSLLVWRTDGAKIGPTHPVIVRVCDSVRVICQSQLPQRAHGVCHFLLRFVVANYFKHL